MPRASELLANDPCRRTGPGPRAIPALPGQAPGDHAPPNDHAGIDPAVATAAVPTPADLLELQSVLLGQESFDSAASAFAQALGRFVGAARVNIGLSRDGSARVVATCRHAEFDPDAERLRGVARAMDEALAQAALVRYPADPSQPPRLALAHAELAARAGRAVMTIPVVERRQAQAAITLEYDALQIPVHGAGLAEHAVRQICPLLLLKHEATRPWHERLRKAFRGAVGGGRRETRWLRRAGVGLLLVMGSLLFALPVPYRVGAPARIEGAVQRALVAPADGFLSVVRVKPGDLVRQDEVLVELAERELTLERNRWNAEFSQHDNNARSAFARGDRTQYVVHHAKALEARAQLQLVDEQLARGRLSAPFDGIVIKGDLTQVLGSPVKRGETLLTVAPAKAFRLIVEVDERDIARVRAASRGTLALAAFPGQTIDFHVTRITPVATSGEARNFYEVEASLNALDLPLRPGLRGVAKIEAGDAPLAWAWTHRLVDWLRLQLWSLGG